MRRRARFGDIWISFVCSGRVSSHFLFWSPTFFVQTKFFKIFCTFLYQVIYSRWVDFLEGNFVGLSEFSNGEAIDDILDELLRQNRRDLKIRYVALISHWIQCGIRFYLFSSCGAATRPPDIDAYGRLAYVLYIHTLVIDLSFFENLRGHPPLIFRKGKRMERF